MRIRVREIVDCIKRVSDARIVLGGPGFNYYGPDWLAYLDLDYGIRGEAEVAFPLCLERLAAGGDIHSVLGCIFRKGDQVVKVPKAYVENLDATAFPAYELLDLEKYYDRSIWPAIVAKRGCAFVVADRGCWGQVTRESIEVTL